jgi:hypothetical protein
MRLIAINGGHIWPQHIVECSSDSELKAMSSKSLITLEAIANG